MTDLLTTHVHHSAGVSEDPWGRRLSSAALVGLPVTTLAVLLMLPADADLRATDAASATKALAAASEHRAGVWIGFLLIGGLYLLMLPALSAVLRAVPGRGRALVRIGYVLASVGACALAIENVVVGVSLRAATSAGLDHGAMVAYTAALQKEHGPLAPLLWLAMPFFVGIVAMAIGVLRTPTLHWWHAVLLVLSTFSLVAAAPGVTGIIACALLTAFAATLLLLPKAAQAAPGSTSPVS